MLNKEIEDNRVSHPEEWTATELFTCLIGECIIHPDEIFENWMHDRTGMIEMVEEHFRDKDDFEGFYGEEL